MPNHKDSEQPMSHGRKFEYIRRVQYLSFGSGTKQGEQAMPDVSTSSDANARTGQGSRAAESDAEVMHKQSVVLAGHRTSVSLESIFWNALREIAEAKGQSVNRLVEAIDSGRTTNLSSAIRVFVLQSYKAAAQNQS